MSKETDEIARLKTELAQVTAELGKTKAELRELRQTIRIFIEQFPDIIYIKDLKHRFIFANQSTLRLFGLDDISQLEGKTDANFLEEDLAKQFLKDEETLFESRIPLVNKKESVFHKGQKSYLWYSTTKMPVIDENGNVLGLIGINRDMTKQSQEMEALQERNKKLWNLRFGVQDFLEQDPERIYQLVVENAVEISKTRSAGFYRYDSKKQQLTLRAGFNRPENLLGNILSEREGLAGYLVHSEKEYIIIEDYAEFPHRIQRHIKYIGSAFGIRLGARHNPLGILYVEAEKYHNYTEDIVEEILRYAQLVNIVISNFEGVLHLRRIESLARVVANLNMQSNWHEPLIKELRASFNPQAIGFYDYGIGQDKKHFGDLDKLDYLALRDYVAERHPLQIIQSLKTEGIAEFSQYSGQYLTIFFVPIVKAEKLFAAFFLAYEKEEFLSDNAIENLKLVGQLLASKLETQKLLQNAQSLNKTIADVSQQTLLGKKVDVLKRAVKEIYQITNCDLVAIYPYDALRSQFNEPVLEKSFDLAAQRPASDSSELLIDMLNRDGPYIVDDARTNEIFKDNRFARRYNIISLIVIPLRAGNERVGVLFVNYRRHYPFTSDDLTIINLLAWQSAIAIYMATLLESTEIKKTELEKINELAITAFATISLTERLGQIIHTAVDLLPNSLGGCIYLTRPFNAKASEIKYLELAAIRGSIEKYPELPQEMKIGEGIAGRIAAGAWQDGYVENDYPNSAYVSPRLRDYYSAVIEVPLKHEEKIIGVLCIYADNQVRRFDEVQDLPLLRRLAAQASIVIQNNYLLERENQLKQINLIALSIAEHASLEEIGELLLNNLIIMIGKLDKAGEKARANIQRIRSYSEVRNHIAHKNIPILNKEKLLKAIQYDDLIYRIVESREIFILSNVSDEPLWIPEAETEDVNSWVCIPLLYSGQVIGLITIDHERPEFFHKEYRELFEPFARQAALAIGKALERENLLQAIKSIGIVTMRNVFDEEPIYKTITELTRPLMNQADRAEIWIQNQSKELILRGHTSVSDVRAEKPLIEKITIGDDEIGEIRIEHSRQKDFTTYHKQVLAAIAELTATAIRDVRMVQQHITAINNVINAIIQIDLDNPYKALIPLIVSLTENADLVEILIWDESRQLLKLKVHNEERNGQHPYTELKPGQGVVGTVAQSKSAAFIPDINLEPNYIATTSRKMAMEIAVPIQLGEKLIGVLNIEHSQKVFTPYHVHLSEAIARLLAVAISKEFLFEKVESLLNESVKLTHETAIGNKKKAFGQFVKSIPKLFACDKMTLFIYNKEKQIFEHPPYMYKVKDKKAAQRGGRVLKDSIVYLVKDDPKYKNQTVIAIEDIMNNPDFSKKDGFTMRESIASTMVLRLTVQEQEECVGIIFINYLKPQRFSNNDIQQGKLLADLAAVAIQNAQLFEEIEVNHDRLNKLIKLNNALSGAKVDVKEIVAKIREATEADRISLVYIKKGENNDYEFNSFDDPPYSPEFPGEIRPYGFSVNVFEKSRSEYIPNVQTNETVNPRMRATGVKTALCVPLGKSDNKIGVMWLHYEKDLPFNEAEINELEHYVQFIAISNHILRLNEQLGLSLKIVEDFSRRVSSITNEIDVSSLDSILQFLVQKLSELRVTRDGRERRAVCHLAIIEGPEDIRFEETHQYSREVIDALKDVLGSEMRMNVDKGITGYIAKRWNELKDSSPERAAEGLYEPDLENLRESPVYLPLPQLSDLSGGSQYSQPIIVNGELFGIINLEHKDKDAFDLSVQKMITALAQQAAVVISNIEHRQMLLQLRKAAERTATTTDINEICQIIAEAAYEIMVIKVRNSPEYYCAVGLLDTNNQLEFVAGFPLDTVDILKKNNSQIVRIPRDKNDRQGIGISGIAIQEARTINVSNVYEKAYEGIYISVHEEVHSLLAVPLFIDNEVRGVINIEHPRLDAFKKVDEEIIELLVRTVADAIHHRELVGRLQDRNRSLANLGLNVLVREHKQAKDNVGVRGLDYMTNNITLLQQSLQGKTSVALDDFLNEMEEDLQKVQHYQDELWEHVFDENAPEEFVLQELIIEIHGRLAAVLQASGLSFELELDPQDIIVNMPRYWFNEILIILIKNAERSMQEVQPNPKLIMQLSQAGDKAFLRIIDNGHGISEEVKKNIFNRRILHGEGNGVGLFLAAAMIEAYKGKIKLDYTSDKGTCILIQLALIMERA